MTTPRRRGTMRSFTWTPQHADEISPCPDCTHWHLLIEVDDGGGAGFEELTIREWHEADCSIWNEAAADASP